MSKSLILNNNTYDYPDNGESHGYGEDASGWAEEVNTVLNTLFGNNDITTTSFSIGDNQSTPANITGLRFDPSLVRSFEVTYDAIRSDGASQIQENGKIFGIYNGSTWEITNEFNGDAGLDFIMTSAGQLQYYSSNIGGTYTGTMKFKGVAIDI